MLPAPFLDVEAVSSAPAFERAGAPVDLGPMPGMAGCGFADFVAPATGLAAFLPCPQRRIASCDDKDALVSIRMTAHSRQLVKVPPPTPAQSRPARYWLRLTHLKPDARGQRLNPAG
jgi:hypothetical protein